MTEVPLTLTVPCVGSVPMVTEVAVPPERLRAIGLLVEPATTVSLEEAAAGTGPAAATVKDTVAADDVPAAFVAV